MPRALIVIAALATACSSFHPAASDIRGPGADYPACPAGPVYHQAPVDPATFAYLEPLGHVFAPGHTWPADHVYLIPGGPSAMLEVHAPASVRVWEIGVTTHGSATTPRYSDYSLRFSPCRTMEGFFHHLTTLEHPALAQAAMGTGPCDESTADNGDYNKYCRISTAVDIQEGALLGHSRTLDWGAYDGGGPALPFANATRFAEDGLQHFDYAHTACPLDAFTEPVREALAAKLGGPTFSGGFVPRTVAPLCGTVMQDRPGTAQGVWIRQGATEMWDVSQHLALVHDDFNPALVTIATGGGPLGIHQRTFAARQDGVVDRDPGDLTPGVVHCYPTMPGSLLIQLRDATTVAAAWIPGDCTDTIAAPLFYER